MPSETKVIVKRVTDYGPKPRSARQTLIQAHAFLAEEGQWINGAFFQDGDPEEAYETAQCSSWSACAMGALGLVTGEMPISVTKEWSPEERSDLKYNWRDAVCQGSTELGLDAWIEAREPDIDADYFWNEENWEFNEDDTPLSFSAAKVLAKIIQPDGLDNDSPIDVVISHNDRGQYENGVRIDSRTRVLDTFEAAIRAAGGEPIVQVKKSRK